MHTWTWEIATGRVSWSDGIEEIVGLERGAFGGTFDAYQRVLHPEDRSVVLAAIARAVADPAAAYEVEHRVLMPDGSTRWLACRGLVVRSEAGAPTNMHGLVWDVTARKTTEARMMQLCRVSAVVTAINKEILHGTHERELLERACRIAVELGGFRFAWVGLLDEASKEVRPVARCGHEDGYLDDIHISLECTDRGRGPTGIAVSTGVCSIADDIDEHPGLAPWRSHAARRGYRSSAAFALRREGRVIGALSIYSSERNGFSAEEQVLLDGLAGDISFALDAMAREDRRRVAEERYRMVVEHATDGIFLADPALRLVEVNGAACAMLSFTREELLRLRAPDLFDPDELGTHPFTFDMPRAGAKVTAERRMRRKDGTFVDVELHVNTLPGGMQQGFARDIGERKQLAAQLQLADRLASLGQLAAGMAHEINNPLAYVALNIELATRALREGGAAPAVVTRALVESEDGLKRIRGIVRELDAFGRGDEQRLHAVDVNRALDAAIRIVDTKIRQKAQLARRYESPPPAHANDLRLGQVFVNLLINAADAIPEDGAAQHEICVRTAELADGRVVVEVSDTGPGMTNEVKRRIFDPFFTTKPIGSGTGLGLAICHRIVTSLGGEISVESQPGRGATFRVVLPAHHASTSPAPADEATGPPAITRARARVLVIDDEKPIARVIKDVLKHHDVTLAESGEQGHALAASNEFACIVCDLLMPDLSGPDLYDRLRADGRGIERRIVFMTGGAFAPRARAFLASVPNPCLDKPFSLATIEATVEQVLETFGGSP
jgi:PAS domain S-box-containing protein